MSVWDSGSSEEIVNEFTKRMREEDIPAIREILAVAKEVGTNHGTNAYIAATTIGMLYDGCTDDRLKYLVDGHTDAEWEEEKKRRETAEKQRRKQSERWQSQGLCRNCGGQLGFFKKCKSCGVKN